ncbi:MAG: TPM domain-containing protein [Pseudomonadota bacterium]|jgi:uncharacterized membrane protein
MSIKRIGKHLLSNRWRVRRAFPRLALTHIESAIKASEAKHEGQIRFVVEGALDGRPLFANQSTRARAIDVFARLRVWDTAHNNGVLIYLLLADRKVEIVADRGIDARVGHAAWQKICDTMELEFRAGNFERGALRGIADVTAVLVANYPSSGPHPNELPDKPVVI